MRNRVTVTHRKAARRRQEQRTPAVLPLLPVREIVVFPYMVLPLPVGREASLRAVESALGADRRLLLVTQQQAAVEEPSPDDLYPVGTVATVLRVFKLPDGRCRLLVQGQSKARICCYAQRHPFLSASVESVEDASQPPISSLELEALVQHTREQLERLFAMGCLLPPDMLILADNYKTPGRLADLIVSNLTLDVSEAQQLLEQEDPVQRLRKVGELLNKEFERLAMQRKIQSEAQENISKTQREYFLREQLRAIQKELGEVDARGAEHLELKERIDRAKMPAAADRESRKQLARLERMHPDATDASVVRTYLDWLLELPWHATTTDCLDLYGVRQVLDEDHYGLESVKDRILEYLGVRKLNPSMRGPILCFVGPPGVGKTSLGKSIARALGRQFVRLSLGGVRDEAEIRGHRRTYVGALPGQILQSMRQVGTVNPVFILDEVDKIGCSGQGDPAAALLEVLDPEQNAAFKDHYLGVPFDLSRVMFIATANLDDAMPPALRDRVEIIRLTGYSDEEKRQIAQRYLLPRQLREHGLSPHHLRLSDATLAHLITGYTREAGVRDLERRLATLCRKIARRIAEGSDKTSQVHTGNVHRYLGVRPYFPMTLQRQDEVGVATGLAWTKNGGEIIHVEATVMPGKGQLVLTGQLGEVMQESARAALSYIRARAVAFGIDQQVFGEHDLHIHVPTGATPKDGPSAGITMATALISALTATPVSHTVALSGEITLRGRVLAVGGIKDKILAAQRAGVRCVVLPEGNRTEVDELAAKVRRRLRFVFAETMDDVLAVALVPCQNLP